MLPIKLQHNAFLLVSCFLIKSLKVHTWKGKCKLNKWVKVASPMSSSHSRSDPVTLMSVFPTWCCLFHFKNSGDTGFSEDALSASLGLSSKLLRPVWQVLMLVPPWSYVRGSTECFRRSCMILPQMVLKCFTVCIFQGFHWPNHITRNYNQVRTRTGINDDITTTAGSRTTIWWIHVKMCVWGAEGEWVFE